MSRRVLLLGLVFASFALVLWSSYQSHFARPAVHLSTLDGAQTEPVRASLPKDEEETRSPLLGKPAPDFTLRDLAGHRVRLSNYRGKAVLINFWATWCAPCRVEMPWFIALRQQYMDQGFEVLGINDDSPAEVSKVSEFAQRMGLNYPVLYGNGTTYADYNCCDALPMSYYLDRHGDVRFATIGLGTRAEMESNIRTLLARPAFQTQTQVTATMQATPLPQ